LNLALPLPLAIGHLLPARHVLPLVIGQLLSVLHLLPLLNLHLAPPRARRVLPEELQPLPLLLPNASPRARRCAFVLSHDRPCYRSGYTNLSLQSASIR
jgi:hypothetical protein